MKVTLLSGLVAVALAGYGVYDYTAASAVDQATTVGFAKQPPEAKDPAELAKEPPEAKDPLDLSKEPPSAKDPTALGTLLD